MSSPATATPVAHHQSREEYSQRPSFGRSAFCWAGAHPLFPAARQPSVQGADVRLVWIDAASETRLPL